ncbi:MAG: flagellar biosynthesis protein FlhF [Actinomycetota bacterium]|nr:flagellar biosynthesis protein FlhF [Actinomycetota bacterium]
MRVKRYEGATIEEALAKVKADLGREAIILHTKRSPKKGPFKFLSKERVEITAALDLNLMGDPPMKREGSDPRASDLAPRLEEKLGMLRDEMDEIKTMIRSISPIENDPFMAEASEAMMEALKSLTQQGVDEELAKNIIVSAKQNLGEGASGPTQLKEALFSEISARVRVEGTLEELGEGRKVIALVGPTGSGKTTTIAKLAARSSIFSGKNVALITADTYRIAAVEQLKIYAEIIGAPVEIVFCQDDMRTTLRKHEDKDLILIDTAGRSPHNQDQILELADLISACQPDQIILVLSLTTKPADLIDAVERFSKANVSNLLFTKLDETRSPGSMLGLLKETGLPLSYITDGQNVPDDIEAASPALVAKIILRIGND